MNVLMLSTTFIPSVLLCGHCQLDYLEKQGKINYKFVPSHFVKKENVEWADVIVFGRSDTDMDAYVAKVAKKAGKHLVYFLDDDILNCPSYLSCYPYYSLNSTKDNIKKCMNYCDTFLTPSPVLLEKYGESFKSKFLISEPSLNRIENKTKNKKVKIGFAGSIDRAQDVNNILKNCIYKLLEKYGDSIEVEFMGAKPDFLEEYNLNYLPYQDSYDAYTAYMSKLNWDIGLAPMPQSDFHRCKYFNKFVEYASFGIAGVYSNCEPYTFGIKDGVNGLLVDNTTEDWVNAISRLIDNEELRNNISDNCIKQAKEIYSLDKLSFDYLNKLLFNFEKKDNYEKINSFILAKIVFFFKRVIRKIKEQGLDFPNWLHKKISIKINEHKDNRKHLDNTNKLQKIINSKKTFFVMSPIFNDENIEDEYYTRVKHIDEALIKEGYYLIYINGEDRSLENVKTVFVDEKHCSVIYNSFDLKQTKIVQKYLEDSGKCMIHGVLRLLSDKVSKDLYKIIENNKIKIYFDTHGMIPEDYKNNNNNYMFGVTEKIENDLIKNSYRIICKNDEELKHFISKYDCKDKIIVE